MKSRSVCLSLLVSCAVTAGCDDPPSQGPVYGNLDAGSDGAVSAPQQTDAGASADGGTAMVVGMDAAVTLPRVGPAYGVVSSDFIAASALSVLDVQGNVLTDSILTSGSTSAGLVTALTGDVELPRHANDPGVMVVLDRYGTDVITRVRLSNGQVLGQVKVAPPVTQQTTMPYTANPQDYMRIDDTTAWVVRSEPNLDPNADVSDRGQDLLRIDPSTMMRTNDRIDLSSLNVPDADPADNKDTTLYARPTRMARVGNTLVVGTARTDFGFTTVGAGAVAIVDLSSKSVTTFEMAGYKNCTDVDNVPGDADTLLVTCSGDFTANDPHVAAGLALVTVHGTTATLDHAWHAEGDSLANPLTSGAVSLGGTLVSAAANDYADGSLQVLATLDLATGIKTEIAREEKGKISFGQAVYDADARMLLVPDETVDANKKPVSGVRRFQRNVDGTFTELSVIKVAVSSNMPVRSIWPL